MDLPEGKRIIAFLYFGLTMVLTVGFGDFYPVSQLERIFIVFAMGIGVAFYAY